MPPPRTIPVLLLLAALSGCQYFRGRQCACRPIDTAYSDVVDEVYDTASPVLKPVCPVEACLLRHAVPDDYWSPRAEVDPQRLVSPAAPVRR